MKWVCQAHDNDDEPSGVLIGRSKEFLNFTFLFLF
jgi:hypothetical protein